MSSVLLLDASQANGELVDIVLDDDSGQCYPETVLRYSVTPLTTQPSDIAAAYVRLPPWRIDIRLQRPLPIPILRLRLWNKYGLITCFPFVVYALSHI